MWDTVLWGFGKLSCYELMSCSGKIAFSIVGLRLMQAM